MNIEKKYSRLMGRVLRFTREYSFDPKFGYICFIGNSIRANNGFSGIIQMVDSPFEESVVAPGHVFGKLLDSVKSDIQLISEGDRTVVIKSGKFFTRLEIENCDVGFWDFDIPIDSEIIPVPSELFPSIRQIYFSICKDETKPNMRGIYCDKEFLYATDNFQMTRFPYKSDFVFFIPDSLLSLILEEEPGPISCVFKTDKVWFIFEDSLVFGSIRNAQFPPCRRVFEKYDSTVNSESKFVEFGSEFSEALERFAFLAAAYPNRVDLTFEPPNYMIIKTSGPGIQTAEEELVCHTNYTGSLTLNLGYLKDVVKRTNKFYIFDDRIIVFENPSGLRGVLTTMVTKTKD
jgi:DNA polymerase III sliding clamp (beta) subunit (PCNA family)